VGTAGERRWVWFFALLITGLSTIPYLIGFLNQGDSYRFTGFVFGVSDGNSYIAKMLSGYEGAWLFSTPYTTYPQRGAPVFLLYLLLGKIAGGQDIHSQLVILFHIYRILAGVLVIHSAYSFVSLFFEEVFYRRISLILITLGGGLGWVLVLSGREQWFGSLPLEFYSPESFGFLAIFGLPHLALARALLLWGFVLLVKSVSADVSDSKYGGEGGAASPGAELRRALKPGLAIGFLWIGVGLAQPVTLALAWGLTAVYLAAGLVTNLVGAGQRRKLGWSWLKEGFWISVIACLVSSPILLTTAGRYVADPFLRLWAEQNILPSPHPIHYLVAYAVVAPFALMGIVYGYKQNAVRILLPAVWVFVFPFLAYAPLTIQRRLPEGVWIALVTLAVLGITSLSQRIGSVRKAAYALVCIAIPSSILLLAGGLAAAVRASPPIYRAADEVAAFLELASRAEEGEVVLSAFETGNALPAWASVRVVIGHGPESVQFEARQRDIRHFFSASASDRARIEILERLGVSYVFWGPEERREGSWDPHTGSFLTPIFESGGYSIFEVEDL
jgi:hypothetical protein